MRPAPLLLALVAACVAAACDGSAPAPAAQGRDEPAPAPEARRRELPPPPRPRNVEGTPPFEYVKRGDGPELKKGDLVALHYVGTLARDGREFASSRRLDEPFVLEIGAGHVIAGYERVVEKLRVGDHVKARIPPDLAYGDAGVPRVVPPASEIVLDLEVLGVVPPLSWEVVKSGDGEQVLPGMRVTVHHLGTLPDGTVFDSSRDRGKAEAFQVGVGEVIEAWDRVVPRMRVGDRWKIRAHWAYAYGPQGRQGAVPPKTDVFFDIEVLGAAPPEDR